MDSFSNPNQVLQPQPATGLSMNIGGVLPVKNLNQLHAEEKAQAESQNNRSYITNLAGHIRTQWSTMRTAKMQTVEPRLLQCLRQRKGEYDPEKQALIKQQGGSDIYLMLSANKARAASSWIRDVISSTDGPLPYTLDATPVPDLPPNKIQEAYATMRDELAQAEALGVIPSPSELEEYVEARKGMLIRELQEEAREAADHMKRKMDDQLSEGGVAVEFNKFIDDLSTFPFAMMKGPIVRKQKTFKWVQGPQGFDLQLAEELLPTWARVDPFMIYWAAHSTNPDDGDMIERHQLSRYDLNAMIGVEGYSDAAVRAVLDEYGRGGLREWLWIDTQKSQAEGKHLSSVMQNPEGLIDALQFWGSVQGKLLIEWGIDEDQVEDPLAEYQIEAWLIGNWVIKAMINPDPLSRKPYYKTGYEEVPGSWMGNSPMDLVRDCQDVCNATARALVNNMGISSGPQVWVNVDRLPPGEQITQLYPWKIHQTTSDPMGASAPPVGFFQPNSLAGELMGIYEKFSVLADEYSGIPRYMTGDAGAGGAGRTASGMSMMMNNAGKTIKQVIANIDRNVITPLIERQWFYNMKYSEDMELKGDVKVVAHGASALMIKDAAAVRRNELLQMALNSPVAQQIIGLEGTAHLMREQVKTLDMNSDKVIPPPEVVKARAAVQQAQAMAQQMALLQQPVQQAAGPVTQSNQQLMDGSPVTDNFSPMKTL